MHKSTHLTRTISMTNIHIYKDFDYSENEGVRYEERVFGRKSDETLLAIIS